MKLRYDASKGRRIKSHGFIWITTFDRWWYSDGQWVHTDDLDITKGGSNCAYGCRSVKAFRRMLKSAPRGVEFILVNSWLGYDVYGVGSNPRKKI